MNVPQDPPASTNQDEQALVSLAQDFMKHLRDLTPGKKLEAKLNREYGPESDYYKGVRVASAFVHLDDPDG